MSFFEIAYININMYIYGVAWIIHLDAAAVISLVIGVKRRREGEENYGEGLVDANAWLRSALHLLQSWPICDRRTVENQSNGKRLRRYRLPLLTRFRLVLFARLFDTSDTRQESLLGFGRAPGRLSRPSCGLDRSNWQFLFKTISGIGTELRVCTQTCRSADWI